MVLPGLAGQIDFELLNNTKFQFNKVWISKHAVEVWRIAGKDILSRGSKQITLVNPSNWQMWDIRIEYHDSRKRWEMFTDGFELTKIKRIAVAVVEGEKWDAHYELR